MVNRKTGTFSMEVKKSVDKGVRDPGASDANAQSAQIGTFFPDGLKGGAQQGEIHSAEGLLHLAH